MRESSSSHAPLNPPLKGEMRGVKSVAIILNGISLKKEYFYTKILPALQQEVDVHVYETRTKHDAVALASKAVDKHYDVICAAGGDGTLNQVVNGMLAGNENNSKLPVLGLIPLGSGNDFARTVNIKPEASLIRNLLAAHKPKPVDVGRITFTGEADTPGCYFINIADVGMGPEVVKHVLASGRAFGSLIAYYAAIIKTFFTYRPEEITLQTPLWKWNGCIRSVAVANGRFFGNGLGIAPDASVDDGRFSCFIAGKVSVLDFIIQNGRLRSGKRAIHDEIEYREASEVMITALQKLPVEADGELVGNLPVKIEMLPGRLKFLW